MGFAVNAARAVPDLHCLCGHCDVLPKKIDKPSIATEKSFCNSKGVRIRSKQCFVVPFWNTEAVLQAMSLYIQRLLPCKSLLGAAQTRCSASCRCRLRVSAIRSFSTL